MASKHDRCWAESVSPCAGGISDEHYLSHGLFQTRLVTVEGLRSDGPATVAVNRLVARCLCRAHNEELSPLDQAAIDTANALRHLGELRVRYEKAVITKPPSTRLHVSGHLLERWALKVAAGLVAVKWREVDGWAPSASFARAAFGMEQLRDGCGLAIVARVGDSIDEGDRWTIKLGRRPEDAHPSGMLLRFRGWPFMLSWDAPFSDWRGMVFDGAVYSAADLLVRPNRFKMNTPGTLALRFSWAPTFAASRELVALHGRYPAPGR